MRLPSGLNATLMTPAVWPLRERISWPVVRVPHFHRLVPAAAGDALAVRAEGHADDTLVWPLRESVSLPVCASQTFTVLSSLPLAMRLPSGLKATLLTSPVALEGERQLAGLRVPHLYLTWHLIVEPINVGAGQGVYRLD